MFAEVFWILPGIAIEVRKACCALAFRGKLLGVSQGRYSFLHPVAWKTAASLELHTVCWVGCVFAKRTERKPKTQLKPFFRHHYTKIVQNKWFKWVGMVCFLPLLENVCCSGRNHLSALPPSEVQCRYALSMLWKVNIFVQLGQPSPLPKRPVLKKYTSSSQGNYSQDL